MPLPDIRAYARLVVEGPGNELERLELLRTHERRVRDQIAELQDAQTVITGKIDAYLRHLEAGTADALWVTGPEWD